MSRARKAGRSSQTQYQGPYPIHLQHSTDRASQKGALPPSRHVVAQAVLWAPTFALQCCGRHQLPYQTNTVRLPPHASGHQQCYGRRHLPYQANMVKPPTCLWASTVWQAPTSAIPEEDDATSHVHLIINSIVDAYHHLVPTGVGSKT